EPVPPIEDKRSGVPDGVSRMLYRMLEKSPDDRYFTPEQVAVELLPSCAGSDLARLAGLAQGVAVGDASTKTAAGSTNVGPAVRTGKTRGQGRGRRMPRGTKLALRA